ncbi:hypothetical protein GJ496_006983 [Pomphorhynchus laevis]|nr:hypothetical protein GJ496_007216 [Pomphorhynchus laevis]KAI0989785.1 hypothetical protein GJ496_006983 [Pomphorhynchus laevis]
MLIVIIIILTAQLDTTKENINDDLQICKLSVDSTNLIRHISPDLCVIDNCTCSRKNVFQIDNVYCKIRCLQFGPSKCLPEFKSLTTDIQRPTLYPTLFFNNSQVPLRRIHILPFQQLNIPREINISTCDHDWSLALTNLSRNLSHIFFELNRSLPSNIVAVHPSNGNLRLLQNFNSFIRFQVLMGTENSLQSINVQLNSCCSIPPSTVHLQLHSSDEFGYIGILLDSQLHCFTRIEFTGFHRYGFQFEFRNKRWRLFPYLSDLYGITSIQICSSVCYSSKLIITVSTEFLNGCQINKSRSFVFIHKRLYHPILSVDCPNRYLTAHAHEVIEVDNFATENSNSVHVFYSLVYYGVETKIPSPVTISSRSLIPTVKQHVDMEAKTINHLLKHCIISKDFRSLHSLSATNPSLIVYQNDLGNFVVNCSRGLNCSALLLLPQSRAFLLTKTVNKCEVYKFSFADWIQYCNFTEDKYFRVSNMTTIDLCESCHCSGFLKFSLVDPELLKHYIFMDPNLGHLRITRINPKQKTFEIKISSIDKQDIPNVQIISINLKTSNDLRIFQCQFNYCGDNRSKDIMCCCLSDLQIISIDDEAKLSRNKSCLIYSSKEVNFLITITRFYASVNLSKTGETEFGLIIAKHPDNLFTNGQRNLIIPLVGSVFPRNMIIMRFENGMFIEEDYDDNTNVIIEENEYIGVLQNRYLYFRKRWHFQKSSNFSLNRNLNIVWFRKQRQLFSQNLTFVHSPMDKKSTCANGFPITFVKSFVEVDVPLNNEYPFLVFKSNRFISGKDSCDGNTRMFEYWAHTAFNDGNNSSHILLNRRNGHLWLLRMLNESTDLLLSICIVYESSIRFPSSCIGVRLRFVRYGQCLSSIPCVLNVTTVVLMSGKPNRLARLYAIKNKESYRILTLNRNLSPDHFRISTRSGYTYLFLRHPIRDTIESDGYDLQVRVRNRLCHSEMICPVRIYICRPRLFQSFTKYVLPSKSSSFRIPVICQCRYHRNFFQYRYSIYNVLNRTSSLFVIRSQKDGIIAVNKSRIKSITFGRLYKMQVF